jgi:hypothetical protein
METGISSPPKYTFFFKKERKPNTCTPKIQHWLSSDAELIKIKIHTYQPLITKKILEKDDDFHDYLNKDSCKETEMLAEKNMSEMKSGDVCQLERVGYFKCHESGDSGMVMYFMPDGSQSKEEKAAEKAEIAAKKAESARLKKLAKQKKAAAKAAKKANKKKNKKKPETEPKKSD